MNIFILDQDPVKAAEYLCDRHEQYKLRYHREHKSFTELYHIVKNPPPWLKDMGLTKFALAMPEPYKKEDPVLSYRLYYVCCKLKICTWKYPAVEPFWVRELVNNLTHFL